MSPQDALTLLDQLVSQMQLSRQVHVQAQQAVNVLQQATAVSPEEADG